MASAGQYTTANLVAILALVLITYLIWRNYRRRGRLVRGAEIAPAVEAALGRLLAGETRFVVLSASPSAYLQFATEANGTVLAEANCPADNQAAQRALSTAGLSAVKGPPNYRATLAGPDVDRLAGVVRDYLDALGASSITIRTAR